MTIRGIDFVQYYVENIQQALTFYQHILNLRQLRNFEDK